MQDGTACVCSSVFADCAVHVAVGTKTQPGTLQTLLGSHDAMESTHAPGQLFRAPAPAPHQPRVLAGALCTAMRLRLGCVLQGHDAAARAAEWRYSEGQVATTDTLLGVCPRRHMVQPPAGIKHQEWRRVTSSSPCADMRYRHARSKAQQHRCMAVTVKLGDD